MERTRSAEILTADGPPFAAGISDASDGVQIRLVGELDLATGPQLIALVDALLRDGHRQLVLNLDDLSFIDASGLRALLTARTRCGKDNANLSITGGRPRTRDLLAMTDLTDPLTTRQQPMQPPRGPAEHPPRPAHHYFAHTTHHAAADSSKQ